MKQFLGLHLVTSVTDISIGDLLSISADIPIVYVPTNPS